MRSNISLRLISGGSASQLAGISGSYLHVRSQVTGSAYPLVAQHHWSYMKIASTPKLRESMFWYDLVTFMA